MDLSVARQAVRPAPAAACAPAPLLQVRWARHLDEVRAAQQLRWRVFAQEMGARLSPPPDVPAGHDADAFDHHCEHLLVCAPDADGRPGAVVGTYRVLAPWAAARAGGLYSETEFDLSPLQALRPQLLELGRSCVDPDWRSGAVILALWAALGEFMQRHQLQTMIGCASVGMRDGGHCAASLWTALQRSHMADPVWQVQPRLPLPIAQLETHHAVDTPPLIKGYLRCGAKLLGAPAWDPDFNTADLPLMMHLPELPARYRRHFLGA